MHLILEPDDPSDVEEERIARHKALYTRLGLPESELTGVDHHVFYTHSEPVWQSFHTVRANGFFHDFGGTTLSCFDHFPYFFCTSSAYRPYCAPFLLEKENMFSEPLLIWSPLPAYPAASSEGLPSYSSFPASLGRPATFYFHPEFILNADTFTELHPDVMAMINEHRHLRDTAGYCPMTEPQIARAIIAAKTAVAEITVDSGQIRIDLSTKTVSDSAGGYRDALGMRICPVSGTEWIGGIETDSQVVYTSPDRRCVEFKLNPDSTTIRKNRSVHPSAFTLERINVPFSMEEINGRIRITTREPGLRWLRYSYNTDGPEGYLPVNNHCAVKVTAGRIELTHYGREPLEIDLALLRGPDFIKRRQEAVSARRSENFFAAESPSFSPVKVIDFGTPEARRFFREGWCIGDEYGDARSFTWSSGFLNSELAVPLTGGKTVHGTLDIRPFVVPDKGSQELTVFVNGTSIIHTSLEDRWQRVEFAIPGDIIVPGDNIIRFGYLYTGSPGLQSLENKDFRLLAAAFDKLVFE